MIRLVSVLFILLLCLVAESAAPPVSIKGQGATKLIPKWNLQVPANQATDLGGIDALIETGSGNILANPGFEASTATSGWTVAGSVTAAAETTNKLQGAKALSLLPSSVNGEIIRQSIADGAAFDQTANIGVNIECSVFANNSGGGPYQVCAGTVSAGTFTDSQCVDLSVSSGYQKSSPAFASYIGTGDPGCRIKSTTSTSAQLYIDNFYGGLSVSLGAGTVSTPLVNYGATTITATTTAPVKGAVVTDRFLASRLGPYLVGRIEYNQSGSGGTGTTGTGRYKFAIPTSTGCTIDTTQVTVYTGSANNDVTNAVGSGTAGSGTNAGSGIVTVYDSTNLQFLRADVGTSSYAFVGETVFPLNASARYNLNFSVPCQGWSSGTSISANQTNYGWTSYTPTWVGLGTPSLNECFHKRDGEDLHVRCKVTSGTSTATEARLPLPGSLVSASTTLIPSIIQAGPALIYSATSDYGYVPLIEPGVGYITFGRQVSGSASGLTKLNGNGLASSGQTFSLQARVPIAGWIDNGKAPQLVNSVVTPSSNGVTLIFSGTATGSGSWTANCTSTPCTIRGGAPGPATVSRSGTGAYAVDVPSGTCSNELSCSVSGDDSGTFSRCVSPRSSTANTSTAAGVGCQDSGAVRDSRFSFTCTCLK